MHAYTHTHSTHQYTHMHTHTHARAHTRRRSQHTTTHTHALTAHTNTNTHTHTHTHMPQLVQNAVMRSVTGKGELTASEIVNFIKNIYMYIANVALWPTFAILLSEECNPRPCFQQTDRQHK